MQSRKLTLPAAATLLVLAVVLLASSLVVLAEPPEQQIPQATVDAAVAGLFAQTATAQAQVGATQTIQAAFNGALTATAQGATAQPTASPTSQLFAIMTAVAPTESAPAETDELDLSAIPQERADDGGFVIGEPDVPITIIEFGDFACPHCQAYQPDIDRFLADFVATGQAKFEYRVFPTAGGDLTVYAGYLLECAEVYQAGAFWQGYQLMIGYAENRQYNQDVGRVLADDLGLSYRDLLECAQGANQVNVDVSFGVENGVTGTPAVMVRYQDGDAQFIEFGGTVYNRGAVPYEILAAVVQDAQPDIN